MSIVWIVLIVIFVPVIAWQAIIWGFETRQKHDRFHLASDYCRTNRRKLLIVGGPWGGRPFRRLFKIPAHPGGDVCLDISRSAIEGQQNALVGTVTQLPFPDKSFGAVFASHLLEHLPDAGSCKQAIEELNRVADRVYLVCPSRQSFSAWLIPDHYLWVWQKGTKMYFKERGNGRKEECVEICGNRF